jgi:hypothetical protein
MLGGVPTSADGWCGSDSGDGVTARALGAGAWHEPQSHVAPSD